MKLICKSTKVILFIVFAFNISFYSFIKPSYAQQFTSSSGIGIATTIPSGLGTIGNIISSTSNNYYLSFEPFDPNIFGVITDTPVAAIVDTNLDDYSLVVTEGEVYVYVSTINGNIASGDLITSSSIPGVGQKGVDNGQVLGVALEDYSNENIQDSELILVRLDIKQNIVANPRANLIQALRASSSAPFLSPVVSLRYVLAVLILMSSFVLGFIIFGKSSSNGIEALGRNPLAKKSIQTSIIFSFIMSAIIMLLGIFLAYLILVL